MGHEQENQSLNVQLTNLHQLYDAIQISNESFQHVVKSMPQTIQHTEMTQLNK